MKNNEIKFLFFLILISKISAKTIKCSYEFSHLWQSDGNYTECGVKNTEIFNGTQINVDKVEAVNSQKWDNDIIRAIHIESAPNMHYFPFGLNNVFKNLIQIAITGCKLVQMTKEDLKVFPKLKNLYLSSNEIEAITGQLFKYNLELEIIDLSYNKIRFYNSRTFSQLPKLRFLDLRQNNCSYLSYAITREKVLEMLENMDKNVCQIAPKNFDDDY